MFQYPIECSQTWTELTRRFLSVSQQLKKTKGVAPATNATYFLNPLTLSLHKWSRGMLRGSFICINQLQSVLIRHDCHLTQQKRAQNKNWLALELWNLCCTGRSRLTSAERPPALCLLRSSHGAARWSLIWALAEGLPESWLSAPGGGRAMLSLLLTGCCSFSQVGRMRLLCGEASLLEVSCSSVAALQYQEEDATKVPSW